VTKRFKMDPTIKLRWTRALSSGEYKQGVGFLRVVRPNGERIYCCLGVLCELHARETGGPGFEPAKVKGTGDLYMGVNNVLPEPVRKWAGLSSTRGGLVAIDEETIKELTTINDEGVDFQFISDWIEKNL